MREVTMTPANKEVLQSARAQAAERPEYDGIKTPIGWYPLVVWTNGRRLLVEGNPPDEEDVDKACSMHDCDAMGCSSFLHALARYDLPDWYAIANPPRLPVRVPKRTDASSFPCSFFRSPPHCLKK
jgi:hypothetical protein